MKARAEGDCFVVGVESLVFGGRCTSVGQMEAYALPLRAAMVYNAIANFEQFVAKKGCYRKVAFYDADVAEVVFAQWNAEGSNLSLEQVRVALLFTTAKFEEFVGKKGCCPQRAIGQTRLRRRSNRRPPPFGNNPFYRQTPRTLRWHHIPSLLAEVGRRPPPAQRWCNTCRRQGSQRSRGNSLSQRGPSWPGWQPLPPPSTKCVPFNRCIVVASSCSVLKDPT